MKKIVKNFNNLINKTIFKVQNKTNNKFTISVFNKYIITLIGLLFFYLFYLLIPLLYDKSWIQNNIEIKILNEFKINISTSADISYRILPAPHFLIKNSKILIDSTKGQKSIADLKNLKVFFSQKSILNKEEINLTKLVIDNANFSLLRKELKTIKDFSHNKFSYKKIIINNSNFFFKNNLNEIITIVKIDKAVVFFDNQKKINLFNLKGNIFGVSFNLNHKSKNNSLANKEITLDIKSLNLNIFNESMIENNNFRNGKNTISFLNSKINTKYNEKKKLIIFESDNSRLNNSKIHYSGKLSTNPFDLDLHIDFGIYKISKLFNLNFILKEFIQTGLLFSENLSLDLSILAKTNALGEIFQNAKINFDIVNGNFNLDKTIFINNKIGLLELNNSNLYLENKELNLNTDILINIKDSKSLFSFLNTNKNSRKEIKSILINLDYNFLSSEMNFNRIIVDSNIMNDHFLSVIEDFMNNNSNNLVNSRRLLNELFRIYEG